MYRSDLLALSSSAFPAIRQTNVICSEINKIAAEESRYQEKQRHAEQMRKPGDDVECDRTRTVRRYPHFMEDLAVGNGSMEKHARQHRECSQIIHVVISDTRHDIYFRSSSTFQVLATQARNR